MGSLMTASRTVNFQQAEVSRLVSHLREQISKQNKALKKAAQQIRENEKILQDLEAAKREIFILKRELGKLPNTGPENSDRTAYSANPSGIIRPIPQQSTSRVGLQFLGPPAEIENSIMSTGGTRPLYNDGFGAALNGSRGTGRPENSLPFHHARQRSLQQTSTQNIPENRSQLAGFRNDKTGVILSDGTKDMGTFKHPDILELSPRKRLRSEHGVGYVYESSETITCTDQF
ncbi:hypothetical protein QFC19_004737 [Naganishia cerealis]|uniref:Uncharacterized protein n=1 Tax=Naganishia cerealis TaxID=610337 RepID=A0ACC2VTV3_9TREE|nr:hypothetical protein QFC19_004737 [Naganishia cerealis]